MKILKYLLFLFISNFLFTNLNVSADVSNLSIRYTKGYVISNSSNLVWNSQNNLNTSSSFNYNYGLGMKIDLSLFADRANGSNVGKYVKINYTTCISGSSVFSNGFYGSSSDGNFTGDFTYYKDGRLGVQGSCSVGGQTGYLSTNYIIFTIKSETFVDEFTSEIKGTMSMWNGATGNTLGYATFNAIDIVEYNPSDNSNTIINQNETIINNQNNINSSLNDIKSDDVNDPSSSINQFKDKIATNGVITQLVGLPVTLFTKVLNSVNGTCSSYNLGSLFGTDLVLPCVNIETYLGSTLWNIIDVLISGLFVYTISKKFIKVFENMSSMNEGDVIGD